MSSVNTSTIADEIDGATVEVIRNYLTSAATEMQRTLIRTAYNTIIYEILDFGISMYDADRRLVADSPGLSMFLGANDYGLRRTVEHLGEENLNPGDIILCNYPYWSSTHTLDVLVIKPVYLDEELIGYTASRAHWLDLGAKDEGYVLDSTDMHQEGVIFPGTKVYKEGEPDKKILDLIRFNSRIPDKTLGDLNAQIAALQTGADRLRSLHEKYGTDTVKIAIESVIDHGERTAREAVEELPDGTWSAIGYGDGITSDPNDLLRIEAEMTIDGDDFSVDLSGSSDQIDAPLNVPLGMSQTLAKLVFKSITTPDENSNEGQYEPLSLEVPPGNLFNPEYPAPTFTLWTAFLAVDVIYEALAKAVPEKVSASSGGDLCDIMLYGEDPETGRAFVEALNEGVGWGGNDVRDGPNALMHIAESMVRNIPIEVFENKAPIQFDGLSLRQDSGGPGTYRGGLGIKRDYRFTAPCGALSINQKTKTEGWGLEDGEPGAKNVVVLDLEDDWEDRIQLLVDNENLYDEAGENLKFAGMMRGQFQPGETISNRSGGGGGYGDPFDRAPEAVREDVIDEYVSPEAAREDYGVVVSAEGNLDRAATEDLRGQRRE